MNKPETILNPNTITKVVLEDEKKSSYVFVPERKKTFWRKFRPQCFESYHCLGRGFGYTDRIYHEEGNRYESYIVRDNVLYIKSKVTFYLLNNKKEVKYFDTYGAAKFYYGNKRNEFLVKSAIEFTEL